MGNEEKGSFQDLYNKVLVELDALHKGIFDESEAMNVAALCLLAQNKLLRLLSAAEFRARSLKRDIDFAKADAYLRHRAPGDDGKKPTENAISALVNKDDEVHRCYSEQNNAEKEAKELANILALLKDAHITFRSLNKKGV